LLDLRTGRAILFDLLTVCCSAIQDRDSPSRHEME
jgi:hypothetical protein